MIRISIDVQKSNKCNGEWSLYVTSPYNQNVVDMAGKMQY